MPAQHTKYLLEMATVAVTSEHSLVESIHEVNARFLLAARDAARDGRYNSLIDFGTVRVHFANADMDSLMQASRMPFLLMDLGVLDSALANISQRTVPARVNTMIQEEPRPSRMEHESLARSTLAFGWHAARTDLGAALLLLGMAPRVARDIAALPYSRVEELAPVCATPLTVRWNRNPQLWSQLLTPSAYGSVESVRGFVMHAVQLTAASHLKRPK